MVVANIVIMYSGGKMPKGGGLPITPPISATVITHTNVKEKVFVTTNMYKRCDKHF
jgi:hypothetical protein